MPDTEQAKPVVRPMFLLIIAGVALLVMLMLLLVHQVFDIGRFEDAPRGLTRLVFVILGSYVAISVLLYLVLSGKMARQWIWGVWGIVVFCTFLSLVSVLPCISDIRSAGRLLRKHAPELMQENESDHEQGS